MTAVVMTDIILPEIEDQPKKLHSYTPIFISQVINSGAKTPTTDPFKLPYIKRLNKHTLTPNGEKMMYVLGGQLNVDYPQIFNKTYNHNRVNVYASESLASQASARAVLMALYNTSDNTVVHDGG
jgi:hypothetical protein